MKQITTYVGIDAHKKDLFIAMLIGDERRDTGPPGKHGPGRRRGVGRPDAGAPRQSCPVKNVQCATHRYHAGPIVVCGVIVCGPAAWTINRRSLSGLCDLARRFVNPQSVKVGT